MGSGGLGQPWDMALEVRRRQPFFNRLIFR